ncbi:MAG: T9SS type A sorting domain-containing protein, partial [Saprospiraceae bacterium]|nr:T9SS type A sorting domain-containing protein [Saprospiraceae bacterium]
QKIPTNSSLNIECISQDENINLESFFMLDNQVKELLPYIDINSDSVSKYISLISQRDKSLAVLLNKLASEFQEDDLIEMASSIGGVKGAILQLSVWLKMSASENIIAFLTNNNYFNSADMECLKIKTLKECNNSLDSWGNSEADLIISTAESLSSNRSYSRSFSQKYFNKHYEPETFLINPTGQRVHKSSSLNHNSESEVYIYPNPADEVVNLIYNNIDLLKNISIYDATGKEILKTDQPGSNFNLNTKSYPDGVYFVVIHGLTTTPRITRVIISHKF